MPVVLWSAGVLAMEAFWGGLALAIISALCVIAYRHPRSYARLYPIIGAVQLAVLLAAGGFYLGHQHGWHDAAGVRVGEDSFNSWVAPFDGGMALLILLASAAGNVILAYLHPILGPGVGGGGAKPAKPSSSPSEKGP